MARGEGNVLFAGPPIKRSHVIREEHGVRVVGTLPGAAKEVVVTPEVIFFLDERDNLRFLDQGGMVADTSKTERIPKGFQWDVSDDLLAWGNEERGFTIKEGEDSVIHKNGFSDQEAVALHASSSHIYCLAKDNLRNELQLRKSSLAKNGNWQRLQDYSIAYEDFSLEKKGQSTLLFYQDAINKREMLMSLSGVGAGGHLDIADNSILESASAGKLIAPERKRLEHYFAVQEKSGEKELVILSPAPQRKIQLQLGRAFQERIATVSEECRDLAVSDDARAFLLTDQGVLAFSRNGDQVRYELDPGDDYNRISLGKDFILLWSVGSNQYYKIAI